MQTLQATAGDGDKAPRPKWAKFALRIARLLLHQPDRTSDLVRKSYDQMSVGYDDAWTRHMRDLSLQMVDRLSPRPGARCLDLACGTGFLTAELASRCGRRAVGVDTSPGMLRVAGRQHADSCDFIHAEATAYLQGMPAGSVDVVTCAWALGYTRPLRFIAQIARVLAPGGQVGIIDNSLFSLAEVLWASLRTFAERPAALTHAMKVRFLPHSQVLSAMLRLCNLAVREHWNGARTYHHGNGQAALDWMRATGAAAGFEFACDPGNREEIFTRFAQILTKKATPPDGVRITHRYIAAVGGKP